MQVHLIAFGKVSLLLALGLLVAKFDIHMAIHATGIALAVLLAVISCNAYFRDRRPKILLLTFAFLLLGVQQVMEAFESLGFALVNTSLPLVGIEFMHVISFGAILFFAAGVLKKT